jgi:hypothetical protein
VAPPGTAGQERRPHAKAFAVPANRATVACRSLQHPIANEAPSITQPRVIARRRSILSPAFDPDEEEEMMESEGPPGIPGGFGDAPTPGGDNGGDDEIDDDGSYPSPNPEIGPPDEE